LIGHYCARACRAPTRIDGLLFFEAQAAFSTIAILRESFAVQYVYVLSAVASANMRVLPEAHQQQQSLPSVPNTISIVDKRELERQILARTRAEINAEI
jgi:hypothetical protein